MAQVQERGLGEGQLDAVNCVRQVAYGSWQPSGQLSTGNRNLASLLAGPPPTSPPARRVRTALERAMVKVAKPKLTPGALSPRGSNAER